jgi:hypothetical protein
MRFLELTGWRSDGSVWIERCEPWSCGYANPIEDAAEFTAVWYFPDLHGFRGNALQQNAPARFQWAQQYLPK